MYVQFPCLFCSFVFLGSSSSFVFGSGSSVSTAGPAFGASQTPTFGQSQASNQTSTPTFGSLSSSSLFPASSLPAPPAFGTVSSNAQPSVFGQQANQPPGFGSGTAPSTGKFKLQFSFRN